MAMDLLKRVLKMRRVHAALATGVAWMSAELLGADLPTEELTALFSAASGLVVATAFRKAKKEKKSE